jgi:hypothetical protein
VADTTLLLRIVDGARQPLAGQTLVTLFDGAQRMVHRAAHHSDQIRFIVPFTDGPNDIYRVTVSADGRLDAGQLGIKLEGQTETAVDVMLLPRASKFDFKALSSLAGVHAKLPALVNAFLTKHFSAADAATYDQLKDQPGLATLLSITSGFDGFGSGRNVTLDDAGKKHPLEFINELTQLDSDRFFATADAGMVDWLSSSPRTFSTAGHALHQGSFASFKETRYLEGNVQFTFTKTPDQQVVEVDVDIDLFRDASHFLLEVVPTDFLHVSGKTDPREAYALRWMGVQRQKAATGLDFQPPFAVVNT